MGKYFLLSNILMIAVLAYVHGSGLRQNGVCSWVNYDNSTCPKSKYLCSNGKCIERSQFCNNVNDCGDNSDERSCSNYRYTYRCDYNTRRCGTRCIPNTWFCDGFRDSPAGEDEKDCSESKYSEDLHGTYSAMLKGLRWLHKQTESKPLTQQWSSVDKSAVALYFADQSFSTLTNGSRKDITYELSIQLLSRLFRTKLEDIPSTELASFMNAFQVSCLDPKNFHGINIVQELRNRANHANFTNPYVLLSLCNAGEKITETDQIKLIETFNNKRRIFWTDMQAVAVMALACARKQPGNEIDKEVLSELTLELKQHQYRNGTVESLQTTALVMQALLASEPEDDPDNFDERKALEQILASQKPDGSFGNLINTYFVLPILSCRSLVNISRDHCKSVPSDTMSALANLANESGPKKRIHFTLWIGNEKDLERNIILRVPENLSLYGVMEIAAEIDHSYRFEYAMRNRKPYVNAISEFQDNPETGKFWFLYAVNGNQSTPTQDSPADVMPKDDDHHAMWYRSGYWF